jgi:hypothetical protein
MTIKIIQNKILPILKRHGVTKAAIFGSFVRGEATTKSDVDLLVNLKRNSSLFDLADLQIDLEKTVGRKVDIVTYGALKHPVLKKNILQEQKIIYEKRSHSFS